MLASGSSSAAAAPSPVERVRRWLRSETVDPAKRAANMVSQREGERNREKRARGRGALSPPAAACSLNHHHPLSPPFPQSLLRAVGLFVGGVIIARNFGDAFNV